MSEPLTLSGNFSDLAGKRFLPVGLSLLFLIFVFALILLGSKLEYTGAALLSMGIIPLLYLMAKYPRFWIYLIAITNIYFFYDREKEVTSVEIILTIQYFGTLALWFFWILFVKRERLIHNIADALILFFIGIVIANFIIAFLNSNDMFYWSREAAVLVLVAIYFPIKKYFTEKKHLIVLMIIYSIVICVSAILHFYIYSIAIQGNVEYAFQLIKSIRVNQTLFGSGAVFGLIYALYNKNKIVKIALILFTCISIVGLLTTYSRTFWLILVVQIIVIIFYLSARQRLNLFIYFAITVILLLGSIFFVFEDRSRLMLQMIENRFVSSGRGTKDISVQARFAEYEKVWEGIKEYPLAGNGLAKKVVFWNILTSNTERARFIHNGYLFIMFKLGIPAFFICFFPYIYFMIKGERLARKTDNEFYRLLCLGSFMAIVLIIIANFTAAQVIHRETSFVTALSFAFISIVKEKKKVLTISSKQLTDNRQQITENG